MVLFLILAAAAALAAALLLRASLPFSVELEGSYLRAEAKLCLLFGLIRIPVHVDAPLSRLLRERQRKKQPKQKRAVGKFLRRVWQADAVRLRGYTCTGRIGAAGDAFQSVMRAGAAEIGLSMLLRAAFPTGEFRVKIEPEFHRAAFWLYMEGILEIVPTKIIGVLIEDEKARRKKACIQSKTS